MSIETLLKQIKKASIPLVQINSFDVQNTITIVDNFISRPENTDKIGFIKWNSVEGAVPLNNKGIENLSTVCESDDYYEMLSPVESLKLFKKLPNNNIIIIENPHLILKDNPVYIQGFKNLRDVFKVKNNCIIAIGNFSTLPVELENDFIVFNENLPDEDEIIKIVEPIYTKTYGEPFSAELKTKVVDALKGLSSFVIEQVFSMSLYREGVNLKELWEHKIKTINNTPGLQVWKSDSNFESIGGLDALKERITRIINGKRGIKVVVWLDEIEKAMAGSMGDTSGTSQDQLGVLLNEMQENDYAGMIGVGVPGAGKSAIAKAIAGECGGITIKLDLGAMKGQYVGLSEERIRNAMKIIKATAGEQGAFFFATSNDASVIKPELKRRFTKGIHFFDLPTAEEKSKIWHICCSKYGIQYNQNDIDFDSDWTGAEIQICASTSYEENISLKEAAEYIIPVAVSGAELIKKLRHEANGKYSSTSKKGVYLIPVESKIEKTTRGVTL